MRTRTITLASTALATALLLAGCSTGSAPDDGMSGMDHGSSSTEAPSSAEGQANAADEMFVQMMIPHHEQAVEMADMILAKTDMDPRVTELAQQIKDAQGPEIETMNGWLKSWGVEAGSAHDMGDDGMMGEDDMSALETATGDEAARLFLEGMIVHHEGAITMAETELEGGQNPEVTGLAQQVIDGQSAEITTMNEILASL